MSTSSQYNTFIKLCDYFSFLYLIRIQLEISFFIQFVSCIEAGHFELLQSNMNWNKILSFVVFFSISFFIPIFNLIFSLNGELSKLTNIKNKWLYHFNFGSSSSSSSSCVYLFVFLLLNYFVCICILCFFYFCWEKKLNFMYFVFFSNWFF